MYRFNSKNIYLQFLTKSKIEIKMIMKMEMEIKIEEKIPQKK
jgi:hypothetical protein